MTTATKTVSPLRQRMIDDMRMRKLAPKTQSAYILAVRQLYSFLKRSPDTASASWHSVKQSLSNNQVACDLARHG